MRPIPAQLPQHRISSPCSGCVAGLPFLLRRTWSQVPIRPLLKPGMSFDAQTLAVMDEAFEAARKALDDTGQRMGLKEDDRVNRLVELMRQETQIIDEEIVIFQEIAQAYGERTSQRLREIIERDRITDGRH